MIREDGQIISLRKQKMQQGTDKGRESMRLQENCAMPRPKLVDMVKSKGSR